MSENIVKVGVVDQYKNDIIKYAMYLNKVRSIPSIKDGLKTIHRRALYSAYVDVKCTSFRNKIKSAKLVGNIMAEYHPHGDTAIYDSLKPMVNWFEINHPLFVGEGNWGTFQGDGAAAMRYTEIFLSPFALDCTLSGLSKSANVVDWKENYNRTRIEPEFLPVSVPLLLINGLFGIGYGLMCRVPAHNINEVIDATIALIKDPSLEIALIPDQCMPCDIINTDFKRIAKSGVGTFKVRGRMTPGSLKIKNSEYPTLTVTSVPDSVYLDNIKDSIIKLLDKGLIPIKDIQDMSYLDPKTNRDVMKYTIVLNKGNDPNFVRDMLYKHTDLEKTVSVSFQVIDGLESKIVSHTEYLNYFIQFRKDTKYRFYSNMYQVADTSLHEKEAFIKVLESGEVDKIINMIKKQKDIDDNANAEYLINKLHITDLQANYILNANIKKLSLGYLNKYKKEAEEYLSRRNFAESMMADPKKVEQEIIDELLEFKKKYGKPRNSKVISASAANNIPEGVFTLVLTENNYIKKVPEGDYGTFKGDAPKNIVTLNNSDNLIMFDTFGKVYKYPVHKIPLSDRSSNGIDLRILIKTITPVVYMMSADAAEEISNKKKVPYILTLSKRGFIKKLELAAALSAPASGYAYINLDRNDQVSQVLICSGAHVVVFTNNKALRINMDSIPLYKRNAKGVKTIGSSKPFIMDGLSLIKPRSKFLLVITEHGKVNKLHSGSLPVSERNKSGNAVIKLNKGDKIKYILGGSDNDTLHLTTDGENIDIPVSDIKIGSSISSGVKLVNKSTVILHAQLSK